MNGLQTREWGWRKKGKEMETTGQERTKVRLSHDIKFALLADDWQHMGETKVCSAAVGTP